MRIRILNQYYDIKEEDPKEWSSNGMGRMSPCKGEILINKNMYDDAKSSTVIHEAIHAIAQHCSLDTLNNDEVAISCIATGILGLIRDNPELIKWIQKD